MTEPTESHEGGCTCGQLRYRMKTKPLIVHCCHCSLCQCQTGSAFAVNALIEASRVEVLQGEIQNMIVKSPSGSGQRIARCPDCKVAVWSEYLKATGGKEDMQYFIRVGTLDRPERSPPDVHIYTSSKLPWVILPPDSKAFDLGYKSAEVWSEESLERSRAMWSK